MVVKIPIIYLNLQFLCITKLIYFELIDFNHLILIGISDKK